MKGLKLPDGLKFWRLLIPLALLILVNEQLEAQTIINGKVIDSETGKPLPFVNVYLVGTDVGTTTDDDGRYQIITRIRADSIKASFVGYISTTQKFISRVTQTIDFELQPEIINLDEVVFLAGENPAYEILRNVVKNKQRNNRDALSNYEHETYTKIEFYVAQMAERFQKKKLVQKVYDVLDTVGNYRDQKGQPEVPIFHSESISKLYIQNNPYLQREEIHKANINGVGIKDKKQVSQLTGVSFQQYNFYDNWMSIINKEFASPISNGWKTLYDYELKDSTLLDGDEVYEMEFWPKNELDLAFMGTMWITKSEYALKKIDASIGGQANLNFIERLELSQELKKSILGPWVPVITSFDIKISELAPNFAGITAKFFISASKFELNKDYPESFYILPIEVDEGVVEEDPIFWENTRPIPLDTGDIKALKGIQSVQKIGSVNFIANLVKIVRWGYVRHNKLDFGPWLFTYAHNNVEGNRFRFGIRTNHNFNEKWVLGGYLAYGTRDEKFKYGAKISYVASKKPYTAFKLQRTYDLEQLGAMDEAQRTNFIFSAASRFGTMSKPHFKTTNSFRIERDLIKGLTQSIILSHEEFNPLFPFAYRENIQDPNAPLQSEFSTSEISVETRFARDEIFIWDNNVRFPLGKTKAPIFTVRYTAGINNILGSDLNYHKFTFRINQRINFGFLGTGRYVTEVGYIPSNIPYPILKNHIGNPTVFFNIDAFNLMNRGEFVSDKYAFFKYSHFFQGYILNRIPLMRKLKWRLVASGSILYGGLRKDNKDLLPLTDLNGDPIEPLMSVESKPYIELGYGIENIMKIFRIMAFHRLSYLDNPGIDKFGIKILFSVRP